MFLTLTANPALDRVFFIDQFIPATTMHPQKVIDSVGGKGFDTSVALRALGQQTLGLGFIAGPTGKKLVSLLEEDGIEHDLVWVEGDTRMANVICETGFHRHSHLMTEGFSVSPSHYESFLKIYERRLPEAEWVIAAGSLPDGLPKDFYSTITEMAHRANKPILIDCAGKPAMEAISAHPSILKMNQKEFAQTFGLENRQLEQSITNAVKVRRKYSLDLLVVTCGEDGIIAITPDEGFLASSPVQEVVNAAGAGDAASACLAWRLSLQDTWPEALRWAAATSAAAVLTERTGDCNQMDIDQIRPSVNIRQIPIG